MEYMKITAKSRYALRTLLDIAISGADKPRTIAEIASSQAISEKFISRIVVPLRRAGLLESERGARGGLRLARQAEAITLFEIVTAMEGAIGIVSCLRRPKSCPRHGHCAAEQAWGKVNDAFVEALRAQTLAEIAENERRFLSAGADGPEYCI